MIRRLKHWLQRAGDPAPESGPPLRILMICMGNICRSPSAEGVLRAKLQQAGLQGRVTVDSAGTHGYHTGEPPDPRAIRHAALRGYDIAGLRARPVAADDFTRFDWLLAMDEDNLRWLRKKSALAETGLRMELLMSASGVDTGGVTDVPDPYYGCAAGFDQVLDLLERACDGLVSRLSSQDRGLPAELKPGGAP